MPELDKPNSHLTTVKWRFPSIHPEGRKYTLIAAFAALAMYSLVNHFLGWLLIGLTIWVAAFFRDPIRRARANTCSSARTTITSASDMIR